MTHDDEQRIRDRISELANSSIKLLIQEHELRRDIRATVKELNGEDKLKVFHNLTSYAYDVLVMHPGMPEFAKVSFDKTKEYFAHQLLIEECHARRTELMDEWFELDEELDDLNWHPPTLLDDITEDDV